MTKKYHVLMSEIHSVWYLVEAKNEKEAINKVSCGDYIEECRESDRGYFFSDDKYIIDIWWDHNKDLYETKTPYMEIKKWLKKF